MTLLRAAGGLRSHYLLVVLGCCFKRAAGALRMMQGTRQLLPRQRTLGGLQHERDIAFIARLGQEAVGPHGLGPAARFAIARSEERRVGEECGRPCRSRWSPTH